MQQGKMVVWGGLIIDEKRNERQRRKGKIYQADAKFQRIARRDKKTFLSAQYKEIEEYSRMGKARDLCKKTEDTKRTFHEKMDTIKDRNSKDLTEARRD